MATYDNSGVSIYPRDAIDPAKKDKEWCVQYAKAAYYDFTSFPAGVAFYQSAARYEEIKLYALGMQPNTKYKKLLGIDELTDETWLNIDWSISHVLGTIRDIAISRMCQQEYGIVATPIDADAKTKLNDFIAKMKAKILTRQLAMQANPELAQHPSLTPESGEPMDMEELDIRMNFGEAFVRSKDAEEMIQLGMSWNDIMNFRRKQFEALFDWGVGGYKEWLEDGKPKFRCANWEAVGMNYCRKNNFEDMHHVYEVIDVDLVDLAMIRDEKGNLMFDDDTLDALAKTVAGKWGNPTQPGTTSTFFKGYDRFKCKVLDLRFFSYNNLVYSNRSNNKGNPVFGEAPYYRSNSQSDKYVTKRAQVVYEVKWIIGTDFAYDWGLMKDQPRSMDPRKKLMTALGYRFFAPNFYEMRCKSMMDRLIPLVDDYQMNVYRLRNIRARMVPDGWWIDLDGLENVALEAGGKKKTPKELLQMFMDTGILVGRSKDIMGDNVNYKPMLPMQNANFNNLAAISTEMIGQVQQMKAMVGLNDATDASTPNPKMLNGVANMMSDNTNNALFPMQFAEKYLFEKLAGDVYIRMQQAIDRGDVAGYVPALNSNTLKYVSMAQGAQLDECGIVLESKPNEDQKQFLIANMQQDVANGFIDSSDVFMVVNTNNLKAAQMLLAYKSSQGKKQAQQNQMALGQQQLQGNSQQAAQGAQFRMQELQLQHQAKMEEIALQGQNQLKIEQLKAGVQSDIATQNNQAKIAGHAINSLPEGALMPQNEPNPNQEQGIPEEAMQ